MRTRVSSLSSLLLLLLFCLFHNQNIYIALAQLPPNTTGYTCTPNQTTTSYPCQTYAFYRATAPNLLDLASIGDLFSVSRLMISNPSNISSSPSSPLIPNQSLFVPLTCSCNSINTSISLSFANLTYTIQSGDTFYYVSTSLFQNLTTYQSVEVVNPTLIPTLLDIGQIVVFPIFCKCPTGAQLRNQTNYLISYVFQPSDTIPSLASRFGTTTESITDVNGNKINPFDTVFIPVSQLPRLTQPVAAPVSAKINERKGVVIGLGIGLGLCCLLLGGLWGYREALWRKRRGKAEEEEGNHQVRKGMSKDVEVSLMADVSDCLDKYRVFEFEELKEATDGFDQRWVIQGSVYKGCIDGELYAIKKMKWNAYEELKILQKVNHLYFF